MDAHQPDVAPEDEREHVSNLQAELAGGHNDEGVRPLCPAHSRLLGLQIIDDGRQVGQCFTRPSRRIDKRVSAPLLHAHMYSCYTDAATLL